MSNQVIPETLLEKYRMKPIEWYKEHSPEEMTETDIKKMFYETFLIQTKTVIDQMVEGTMKTEDCADELYYREIARQELAKLNGEEITETAERKTLEERATDSENVTNELLGNPIDNIQASEQFRRAMQMFAQTVSDDEAMEIATIYPVYTVGKTYKADEMFIYGENGVGDPQLYRVVQDHTSQSDWTPDTTSSLYTPIGLTEEGFPVWSRPTGAHDAYMIGDVVDYNGTLYESLIDGNVYSPDEYPDGWEGYVQ